MVTYVGLKLARNTNMFLAKHRVLKYYRPCMIVCQVNLDYENHLKIPFGTYVLANNKPKSTNTNAPIILYCIYLQASDRAQVVHKFLHLQTTSVITSNHITPALITPTNINQVHSIAYRKGRPSRIIISNITGLILYYSAWIVGVDYSEEDDDENEFKMN